MKRLMSFLLAVLMFCSVLHVFADDMDMTENTFKLVTIPSGRYMNYDTEYMLTYPKTVNIELKIAADTVIPEGIIIESVDPYAVNFEDPEGEWSADGNPPAPVAALFAVPDEFGVIDVTGTVYFLGEYIISGKDPVTYEEICQWTVNVIGIYEEDIRFKDGMVMEKMMLEGSKGHRHNFVDEYISRTEYVDRAIIHTCTFCGFNYREKF